MRFLFEKAFINNIYYYRDVDPIDFVLGDFANDLVESNHTQNKLSHSESHGAIKQTYSRLSTMYCMLPEYHNTDINDSMIKSLNLETLALKWMDQSFEVKF